MNVFSILLIAVGLAMDAFAVAVSAGVCINDAKPQHMLKFGLFFGAFQFFMPLLGYWGSQSFSSYLEAVDHLIACGVLVIIGSKMLYEASQKDDCPTCEEFDMYSYKKMTLLAIATSIDALAVGVSFAITDTNILSASIIIGIVAFVLSYLGVYIGKKLGCVFQKSAEKFGGIILIAIGVKILLENI